jgi:hypothetical protein
MAHTIAMNMTALRSNVVRVTVILSIGSSCLYDLWILYRAVMWIIFPIHVPKGIFSPLADQSVFQSLI